LKQIAQRLGISRDLIRKVLMRAGVKIKSERRALDFTGQTAFGWKREKGRLVPHVAEQKLIGRMVEARRAGLSLHAIARAFTAEKVRTKNGGRWHAKSVSQILACNARLLEKGQEATREQTELRI